MYTRAWSSIEWSITGERVPAGMSISGVRTCYSGIDTDIVQQNIGRRPTQVARQADAS